MIIGAGLAGLHAASLLEDSGAKVIVLEGANRIGGRVHTLLDVPGQPPAGGIQIGSFYTRLIAIAKKLGVELTPGGEFDRSALYAIGGQAVPQVQWPTSEANKLVGGERAIPPFVLAQAIGRRMPQLSSIGAWMGDEGRALDIPYSAALRAAGASDEAIRLIGCNLDRGHLDTLSALNSARSAAIYRSAGTDTALKVIAGGGQKLTDAMATVLHNYPRLNQVVTGIAESESGVRIDVAGSSSITARHVICTIPFSVLRTIGLQGPSAEVIRTAIATLPYDHASFAYLSAREPFWKNDGLPSMVWSDDPQIGRVFVLGDDPALLKVWLAGPDADAIDRLPHAEAGAAIIARLEAARPSARGQLRLERMFSWQDNLMARGTYHRLNAGQAPMLAAAATAIGQRLHFAGEHLAQLSSGLEGALESGARAAQKIMQK